MALRSRLRAAALAGALVAAGALVGPHVAAATTPTVIATPVLGHEVIGYSVRHRPIVAYHLGNPAAKRTALLIGQMHGDEHAGVLVARTLLHIDQSISGVDLWVIPTMNPDGNAAGTRQNADGVDLNRNWPDHWVHNTTPCYTGPDPLANAGGCNSGPRPLSEPEDVAVHRFLRRLHPHYVVVLHQPLDGVDSTDGTPLDPSLHRALVRNLHMPSKAFVCWSVCHGSMTGWYTDRRIGISDTVEFGYTPSDRFLTRTAPRGIVRAFGGTFGPLATRNPRLHAVAAASTGHVSVHGWAFDPDQPRTHLVYEVYEGGRLVRRGRESTSAVHGGGIDTTFRATPGRHVYCTYALNVGAGNRDPHACSTVRVP